MKAVRLSKHNTCINIYILPAIELTNENDDGTFSSRTSNSVQMEMEV